MDSFRFKRAVFRRWLAISLVALALLVFRSDSLSLSATERASTEHAYDLVGWHITNFASKWMHWLWRLAPGLAISDSQRLEFVELYFEYGASMRHLQEEIAVAAAAGDRRSELIALDRELESFIQLRGALRNDVEETIESAISSVVRDQGLGTFGEIIIPPVDVRLETPPTVLVTSLRERIERLEDVLIEPGISVFEREELESRVEDSQGVSALVLDIGGVATFPASIHSGGDLRNTLRIAAHEWIHHHLFLKPVGRDPYATPELMVINETVASIAGEEIGDLAYEALRRGSATTVKVGLGVPGHDLPAEVPAPVDFDFGAAMQETRVTVDSLLATGQVDRAEAHMEKRRQVFARNGHPIRRLNQAYFAFNGTYGDSPGSVDPIGPQVRRLRELTSNVGEFLSLAGTVSSYEEFVALLARTELSAHPR